MRNTKIVLSCAVIILLAAACGTSSKSSKTSGAKAGFDSSGQWTGGTAADGAAGADASGAGDGSKKKLTDADFKVRVVKSVEAPTYLAGIEKSAQDSFRLGVLAVTDKSPNLKVGARFFQKAIEKDAAFREAYFNLGMCLERMGEREDALDVYKSALDRNPGDATAGAYIAKLYLGKARQSALKGRFEARDSWLTKAKSLLDDLSGESDGTTAVAVNNALALYYLAKEDIATAEKYVKNVLYAEPTNVTGLNTRGLINLKHKKYLIARYIFNKVLRLDPGSTEALTNLGYTMVVMGERKKAMEKFLDALRTDPSNMDVRMNIAALLLEHLHYDRAYAQYRTVLEAEPLNLEAHEGLCDSSFGMAGAAQDQKVQYEKAISCFESFLTKRPERTDLWERIAKTYQVRLQDFDNAVKYYEIYLAKAKLAPKESDKISKMVRSLKDIISKGGLKAMMEEELEEPEEKDDEVEDDDSEDGDDAGDDAKSEDAARTSEPSPKGK